MLVIHFVMSSSINNRQNNVDEARQGYPALAWFMSKYPELAIFRRFSELNLINLLRLQAELQDLEHQLDEARREDSSSDNENRQKNAKDFWHMRDKHEDGTSSQYEVLIEIGKKLDEYSM